MRNHGRDLAVVAIALGSEAPFMIWGVVIGLLVLIAGASVFGAIALVKNKGRRRMLIELRPKGQFTEQ